MAANFADDIFKEIFLSENRCILLQISSKIFGEGPIYHKLVLVQVMMRRHIGNKPLAESIWNSGPNRW